MAAILGEWNRFFGSVGQLVVNLTGIVVAAAMVLLLRKGAGGWPIPVGRRPRR